MILQKNVVGMVKWSVLEDEIVHCIPLWRYWEVQARTVLFFEILLWSNEAMNLCH